jgi:Arc/MetJ-type ribon-helix-helix transcriptional regulator
VQWLILALGRLSCQRLIVSEPVLNLQATDDIICIIIVISAGESLVPEQKVRTTLALPADLLSAVDRIVEEGKAHSRNEFVAAALRRELAARRRAEIDAAFDGMANDADYLAESSEIENELAGASWEALRVAEHES